MTGCSYGWLYDRTSDCENYGCNNNSDSFSVSGYWTSTSAIGGAEYSSPDYSAWYVGLPAKLDSTSAFIGSDHGVRPVIEVLISNL